ncbi:helix-turn-helix transcriptional regulator [Mitsuokella jalaludinii]|uniref:WYL domain-containing protein n=1 Tax=Mitsuokella jalaludinii TaxID=187979 RepID=A0A174CEG0_9FIRM|nr:WYL domain-containing protein [Mitsuokella jalaludinii]CUO10006.1 Uncharacterised protein [Mitsuokella jalaludinii]
MPATLDYNGDRGLRMLDIFERLNKGERISKRDLTVYYGVGEKTIQRDIEDIRNYLAEKHGYEPDATIKYNRGQNCYYLVRFEREWLSNQEVLAICKILLESRAFAKEEMNRLLTKLLAQATPTQRKVVEGIIKDESVNYVPLQHKKPLLENLWQVSDAIVQEHPIRFSYTRQDGRTKDRTVKPLAIIFSEFYFYLIGLQTYETGDAFRTYRLDRIANIITSEEKFRIPYRDKFRDSEFRKRVQFMYDGELMTVKFRYFGSSVEHVLDRLLTAKAKQRDVSVYDISAEVYGDGILIWLLSQGSQVEVYAPEELRQKWLDEASRIVASCDAKEGAWRQ